MTDAEHAYITLHKQLVATSLAWEEGRRALIVAYVMEHYPGTPIYVVIDPANTLALDISMKPLPMSKSRPILDEVMGYLRGLQGES